MDNNESNNNFSNEVKDDMQKVYEGAKEYITDEENKEKVKKGLKVAKGVGIGYLAFIIIVLVLALVIFFIVLSGFFKIGNQNKNIINKSSNIINQSIDQMDIERFNLELEDYNGSKYGYDVKELLDEVVLKLKKNTEHSITLIYENTSMTNTNDIINLKKQIDDESEYEIVLDYDKNGYINKITISKY